MGVIVIIIITDVREGLTSRDTPFPGKAPVKTLVILPVHSWLSLSVVLVLDHRLAFLLTCKQLISRLLSQVNPRCKAMEMDLCLWSGGFIFCFGD